MRTPGYILSPRPIHVVLWGPIDLSLLSGGADTPNLPGQPSLGQLVDGVGEFRADADFEVVSERRSSQRTWGASHASRGRESVEWRYTPATFPPMKPTWLIPIRAKKTWSRSGTERVSVAATTAAPVMKVYRTKA